jgi:ABC-type glycerol-3-phosphate transport system substrate-binding protein
MRRFPLLVLLVLLAACAPATPLPAPMATTGAPAAVVPRPTESNEPVTVSFAGYDSEREYYQALIDRFNADNADVQVAFVSLDQLTSQPDGEPYDADKIIRALVSGADTAVYDHPRPEDIARGYLRDLQPFIDADAGLDRDDFFSGALDRFSRDGGVYLVPQFIHLPLLSYNRDLWASKRLPPPKPDWTMADLLAAAGQIAERRGDEVAVYGTLVPGPHGVFGYELEQLGIDTGGALPEQIDLGRPEVVAALERVLELGKSGTIYAPTPPPPGQPHTDDYQGIIYDRRAGMWSPITIYWGSRSGPPPFEVGTAPQPGPEVEAGTSGYIMSAGTQHSQAAWRWLAFLSQQRPSEHYRWSGAADADLLPARRSVAEQAGYWSALDAEARAAVEAVLARPVRPLPATYDTPLSIPLNIAIEAVLRGEKRPAEALRDAQAQLEQQLAQAQRTPVATPGQPIVATTPQTARAAPDAAKIVFAVSLGVEIDPLRRLAEQFNRQHPGIFIDVLASDGQTLAALAAKSDCFMWFNPPEAADFDGLLDLQPLIDADQEFKGDDYPPLLLAPFRRAGGLYGLPQSVSLRMLVYNKVLFDLARIPYPSAGWTLDDLIATAKRLSGGAGANKRYGFAANYGNTGDIRFFMNAYGAVPLTGQGDQQQPDFTNPRVVHALRAYLDLLRSASPHKHIQGYAREWISEGEQMIGRGQVAMWFDHGFDVAMRQGQPTSAVEIAIGPPPLASRALTPDDFFTDGLYISAKARQPAACWTWLSALSAALPLQRGAFAARASLAESQTFLAGAVPGAQEVYQVYRAALARTPDSQALADLNRSPIDFYWFYRAVDRALQGHDLDRELEMAQGQTEQHLACVRAGGEASDCAKQVDSEYSGWKSTA